MYKFLLNNLVSFVDGKIPLLDKIFLIMLTIAFSTTMFVLVPTIILTEEYSILCDSKGTCSYSKSIINKQLKNQINFNINKNSKCYCQLVKTEKEKNYYRLIITETFGNQIIEIPSNNHVMPMEKCNLFKTVIENNIENDDKTLAYRYYPNKNIEWWYYIFLIFLYIANINLIRVAIFAIKYNKTKI